MKGVNEGMAAALADMATAAALIQALCALSVLVLVRRWRSARASGRSLAGQLVLITGAGGGLGRALALEFARHGAVLALWDVQEEALEEARAAIF